MLFLLCGVGLFPCFEPLIIEREGSGVDPPFGLREDLIAGDLRVAGVRTRELPANYLRTTRELVEFGEA